MGHESVVLSYKLAGYVCGVCYVCVVVESCLMLRVACG
jgi:hypothetical protein